MQRHDGLADLRILVVEDQALLAMQVEGMLRKMGCEIVGPVPTSEAALSAVRTEPLDGVLLDVNLHGEDASPVAEELRRRQVPFLLVTGYSGRNLVAPAFKDAPMLRKPFSQQALADAMTKAFFR